MKRWSKSAKLSLAILLLVVLFGAGGLAYWKSQTYPANDRALQALQSDAQVVVGGQNGLITFEPVDMQASIGFVFHPGAGVAYRAYAPVLRQIAARGYFVVLVPAPLNFPLLNSNAATEVMERFPEIEVWAVGGHSLGGVTAAAYAERHPDQVEGVVFFASYPADDGLKNTMVRTISIYGTNDGLATPDLIDESRELLSADAMFVQIEGGNHSQFGSYGFQSGDREASISPEEQWAQVADATASFLESLDR